MDATYFIMSQISDQKAKENNQYLDKYCNLQRNSLDWKVQQEEPIEEEEKKEENNGKCICCYENEKTHIFKECGHFCICENCSKNVDNCPICRNKSKTIRVFSS